RNFYFIFWLCRTISNGNANASYKQTRTSASVNITTNKPKKKASIMPALFKAFGSAFLFGVILQFSHDILMFAPPQILRLLIQFVDSSAVQTQSPTNETQISTNETQIDDLDDTPFESQREPLWRGIFYAILLFVVAIIKTILTGQFNQRLSVVALRIRTAIIGVIYRKALVLSNTAKKETATGEIVNLMAVDAQCFMDLLIYVNSIWSAPLQIILALYFLWGNLGPSVLAGLAVMILLSPISNFCITRLNALEFKQRKNKDNRVKLMNEILGGIKVLKLNAWEPSFTDHILRIRLRELHILKQYAIVYSGTSFLWLCAPFLVSIVTFVTYIYTGDDHILTAEKAFVCLTLFDIIKLPLSMLPLTIAQITQARVSINRINEFLNREELDPSSVTHNNNEKTPLSINNGTFTWGDEEILKNLNFKVHKRNLVAVVGGVGSGKSSLLSALLGEMDKVSGHVNTVGKIAYVSQQAWIQNATLQDNILFGKPMNRKRYDQVIGACALKKDLAMLAKGDQTEIGEKGINVSGGQKQRISIARAVYADADVYFLDDPLSAVDSHVGKHIFEQVIGPNGLLADKTRVLVTHGVTYLKQMDNIFVLKDGKISETGTLQELLDRKGSFADFLIQHIENVKDEESLDEIQEQLEATLKKASSTELLSKIQRVISRSRSELNSETASVSGPSSDEGKQLEEDKGAEEEDGGESTEEGSVKWSVYQHYLKSFGIGFSILTVVLIIVFQALSVGSNIWISRWSSDKTVGNDTVKRDMYITVYAAFGGAQAVAVFISTLSLFLCALRAAEYLHNQLLKSILRAPTTTFFDVTPTGRILNRFSSDINSVDSDLPAIFHSWAFCFFRVLATFTVISISVYWFLIVIIPVGILYYFSQKIYIASSRQLQRLEATSLSPVYSHFSESIQGASSIRAFEVSERFIKESGQKVDFNQACYYPKIIAERWLAVRLELIGNFIILFAALFAVLSRDTIEPGTVGLCILYALQITQDLHTIVNMNSMVEMSVVSVERIKQYSDIEPEAPWKIPYEVLPKKWPEMGKIQFENYDLRYRKGLELILRNINLTINSGERVGIVGRTGAGKSTLTLALFRIVEAASGKILIDGQDISKLGLHSLRSKLTIIPQDPVLFSGSLRLNLDPTDSKTDTEVWKALELTNLQNFVQGLLAGLNYEITEGGENLSVGQRQLVCLARALLRKTKVLILDEATAAVDLETDELVQRTIKTEFKGCTILTIAHRLNTILDSDKVIVLDNGEVREFNSPKHLLADTSSLFYSLAKDAGLVKE
ncbi:Multidrug resistance-associated protein 1, partial [Pseudolycoriella hygida]